jgi:hypothetical protein
MRAGRGAVAFVGKQVDADADLYALDGVAEVECQQLAGGHGEKHVTRILDKLGAVGRTQAVARARNLAPIR